MARGMTYGSQWDIVKKEMENRVYLMLRKSANECWEINSFKTMGAFTSLKSLVVPSLPQGHSFFRLKIANFAFLSHTIAGF